ncbi:hypothetical protein [Streptomyces palmae]|uniref:WXG100 family type VII secretion target n=1 Tax=Streptomyces palmae TaxID=1701085 RepID=A0A4Z0H6X1_9ACTN|nr:hypothetical protein [Streptomyces palmae]TGB05601.1 hypothetical protein E4099_19215 [Streptomyces palmae]
MSELDVDSEGLNRGGEALDDVGNKIKLIRDEYVDKITSYRGCWGTGEFGETFAKKYYEGLNSAVEGVEALSKALEGSAESLKKTAGGFRKGQQNILDGINHNKNKR